MNMKRILCVILAVLLMLGVFAGCSGNKEPAPSASPTAEPTAGPTAGPTAEPTASPDAGKIREPIEESSWLELSHSIYEKNQLDALLGRHSSLQYDFIYPEKPEWNNCYWENADYFFEDWPGFNYKNYRKGHTYYRSQPDDQSQIYLSCGISIEDGYNPFFDVFGISEENFLDTKHEGFKSAYKEDGLIHILTVYDDARSRDVIESTLKRDYDGEIIHAEIVVDAETCDLVSNSLSAEKDGKTQLVYSVKASYDTEEPSSFSTLRAAFETSNTPMKTVDVTVDEGSDHEYKVSLTVPQSMYVSIDTDDDSIVFCDPDYSSIDAIIHWDGASDLSLYVLTDPSDALFDRYFALAVEAIRTRKSVYGIGDVSIEALVEANKPENVLKHHETVYCVNHPLLANDWYSCYRQGLYYESNYGNWENLIDSDGNFYRQPFEDGEVRFIGEWFAMSDEEKELMGNIHPEDFSTPINEDTTATEELVNAIDNGNGTLTVFTRMNEENTRAALEVKNIEGLERFYGATIEIEYLVSAETLEILNFREYLIFGEERMLFVLVAVCYDLDLPEWIEEMQAEKVRFLTCDGAEKTKTIRIIYDAGTENEVSYMTVIPEDDIVNMIFRQGYTKVYADAQKTELFQGKPDESGVFNLYLFYGE